MNADKIGVLISVNRCSSAAYLFFLTFQRSRLGRAHRGSIGINRAGALPLVGLQYLLAQADAAWRDFDELVFADEFDGLLEVENAWRHQADAFVGGGSAHVGELLFLDDVDVEIGIAGVFADDHAFVDLGSGRDENLAAFLEVEDGVAGGSSGTVRHQGAGGARGNFALPLDVAVEERVHDGSAARIGEDFAAQADQTARGHVKFEAHTAGAVVDHLDHLAFAGAEFLDDHAEARWSRWS